MCKGECFDGVFSQTGSVIAGSKIKLHSRRDPVGAWTKCGTRADLDKYIGASNAVILVGNLQRSVSRTIFYGIARTGDLVEGVNMAIWELWFSTRDGGVDIVKIDCERADERFLLCINGCDLIRAIRSFDTEGRWSAMGDGLIEWLIGLTTNEIIEPHFEQ
jgi:hypothetical protein